MTIKTPEFQGTHLWDRLCWAKEKLEPHRTEYCVVWEDPETPDEPAKVTHPDPNWMACALKGGILPPVEAYWELKKDESEPSFTKHTRGYLLHNTKPIDAMTEEQAVAILEGIDEDDLVYQIRQGSHEKLDQYNKAQQRLGRPVFDPGDIEK